MGFGEVDDELMRRLCEVERPAFSIGDGIDGEGLGVEHSALEAVVKRRQGDGVFAPERLGRLAEDQVDAVVERIVGAAALGLLGPAVDVDGLGGGEVSRCPREAED